MNAWTRELEAIRAKRKWIEIELARAPRDDADRLWQEDVRANISDAADLNKQIASAGVPLDVGELANTASPYAEIHGILAHHLDLRHRDDVYEAILRALTVKDAGEEVFCAVLSFAQRRMGNMNGGLAFAVGNALAEIAGRKYGEDLFKVASNSKFGDARIQPIIRLAKSKDPRVPALATALLRENDLAWAALHAVRIGHFWDAVAEVRPYLESESDEIRGEARKYLNARERAER